MRQTAITVAISIFIFSSFADSLSFQVQTVSHGGMFGPAHCFAAWINNSSDKFIRSLEVNAERFEWTLIKWISCSNHNKTDAITSASLYTHRMHNLKWNCKDTAGNDVPNGDYKIYVEFTENNGAGPFICYTFTKGSSPKTITPADQPYFKNAKIVYAPSKPSGMPLSGKRITTSDLNLNLIFRSPGKTGFLVQLPGNGDYELIVYSILGRKLWEFQSKESLAGFHEVAGNFEEKNGGKIKSGLYIATLRQNGKQTIKKIILRK